MLVEGIFPPLCVGIFGQIGWNLWILVGGF
jgi:hypothetical protein